MHIYTYICTCIYICIYIYIYNSHLIGFCISYKNTESIKPRYLTDLDDDIVDIFCA